MDGEIEGILLLLVSALGQVAIATITGVPVHSHYGLPSGFRGGSLKERPGQNEFIEARRQWAGIAKQPLLSHVQVCLLIATYLNTCADVEAHRLAISDASKWCGALLQTCKLEWASPACKPLRQAYWTCMLNTGCHHLYHELLDTNVRSFYDKIPPPNLRDEVPSAAYGRDYELLSSSVFQEIINLEKLAEKIRVAMQQCKYCNPHFSSILLITSRSAIDWIHAHAEPCFARDHDL